MTKIIRKWLDKTGRYQYGIDENDSLYCRDMREQVNMVCTDVCYKKKEKYYYRFVNPVTGVVKLVQR